MTRAERIRVRGLVQGVGFRPTVWRLATALDLRGDVINDGDGVLIRLWGNTAQIDGFCARLRAECPPLARIDAIERSPLDAAPPDDPGFRIGVSGGGQVHTASDGTTLNRGQNRQTAILQAIEGFLHAQHILIKGHAMANLFNTTAFFIAPGICTHDKGINIKTGTEVGPG